MLSGGIDVLRCRINVSKLYDSELVMFIRIGVASVVVVKLIILSRCTT